MDVNDDNNVFCQIFVDFLDPIDSTRQAMNTTNTAGQASDSIL